MQSLKKILLNFLELTRAYSVAMTFAGALIIISYAYYSCNFSFRNFFILLIGVSCVHLGGNLFDDYIDVKNKLKTVNSLSEVHFNHNKFKAKLITEGTYSLKNVEFILIGLFGTALFAGLYFIYFSGLKIIPFMLIGAILTLIYPISSKYYMSEIIIGLLFGPLLINGGYYALTQEFNTNLIILSFAIFFTTIVLLHTHSLMDWEYDIKENKNTLCILSKSKENALLLLKIFVAIPYVIITTGVFLSMFNPYMLFVFLTLPMATKLIESMDDYIKIKNVEFKPRWYFGVFENWQTIKEKNIDFFMFRFYLARNYSFFFALFASLGAMGLLLR